MLSASEPAKANLIKDTTTAAFRQDVIAESMNQPVLVDFWAPWCGPCKQLGPVIEKAVNAAAGKVKLVKMNIDDHPSIPGQLGIKSIPAVIAFSRGQPVDGFVGALPEGQVKQFIERIAGPIADPLEEAMDAAKEAVESGDIAAAAEIYGSILASKPDYSPAIAGLAKVQLDMGQVEQARRIIDTVPASGAKDASVGAVRAAIELAEQTAALGDTADLERRLAANPKDHQARFDLAIAMAGAGKREIAIDHLIAIIKADRAWNEDGARKQLVQFFEAWGPMDEMTIVGRRKLSALLFR